MGYTKQVVQGFSWRLIFKIVTAVVTAGKLFITSRLLEPSDVGLFATVAIALGLTESVTETGINLTILQSKYSVKYFLDTAWVVAILRGFVIAIIMIALGFFLSAFMDVPQLTLLVGLASLIPVFKGFINPGIISFHKNFQFFQDSLYHISLTILNAALTIGLVWLSPTVESLIWSLIIGAVGEVIISFVCVREWPKFQYLPARAQHIFNNAHWMSLSTLLTYLNENIDDLIIGRLTNPHTLGLYHNAYALGHKPNYELTQAVHHGALPVYTRIADDAPRLRRAFWRSSASTAVAIIGLSIPFLLFPGPIVRFLLGEKWLETIPLIPWLTLAGLLQGLSMLGYSLLLSCKNYRILNLHLLVTLCVLTAGLWWFTGVYGVMGAVVTVVVARAVTLPVIGWGVFSVLYRRTKKLAYA